MAEGPVSQALRRIRRRLGVGPAAGGGGSARDRVNQGAPRGGSRTDEERDNARTRSREPLGVPRGYTVMAPRSQESLRGMSARGAEAWSGLHAQGPRYFDGDEFKPSNEGFDAIIEKQRALAIAGYLDPNDPDLRWGKWDSTTRSAYRALLEEANGSGMTADAMLQESAMSFANPGGGGGGGAGGGGGGGRGGSWEIDPNTGELVFVEEQYVAPPLPLRTTSKDDLRAVFRKAVIGSLGQGWDESRINELVDSYNWMEIKVQKDAYDKQVAIERADFEGGRAGQGGETIHTVDMASPEAFLEQQMIERDPEKYKAGRIVNDAVPAFMSAMKGWV